jgi:hypothetical protein
MRSRDRVVEEKIQTLNFECPNLFEERVIEEKAVVQSKRPCSSMTYQMVCDPGSAAREQNTMFAMDSHRHPLHESAVLPW